MAHTLGIGFLGAGPVTQAIHLPTLAWMTDRFHVSQVMDVDRSVAEAVAARCGAKATTFAEAVIEDRTVDVVAICSPNAFHAEQVIMACEAGKRAILCEKPLAVTKEEAAAIATAARRSGTTIFVGTMQAYDPAYRKAAVAWIESGDLARLARSSIYLPSNNVFIEQATEIAAPEGEARPRPILEPAAMMRNAILGLAIHNIPVVRDFYPAPGKMSSAHFVVPFGYAMTLENGAQAAQFNALMPGDWAAHWAFCAFGDQQQLRVTFPPSYVLAGSARAELIRDGKTTIFEYPQNGYEKLWEEIDDVCHDRSTPSISLETAIADLEFALDMAEKHRQIDERSIMTRPMKVFIPGNRRDADEHRATLATLPMHFTFSQAAGADIALLSPEHGSLISPDGFSGRIYMLSSPGLATRAELDRLEHEGKIVVPAFGLLSRTAQLRGRIAATPSLVQVDASGQATRRSILVEVLVVITDLFGPIRHLQALWSTGSTTLVEASLENGAPVEIHLREHEAKSYQFSLEAVGKQARISVDFDTGPHAAPSKIFLFEGKHTEILPPLHQSSARLSWMSLAEELQQAAEPHNRGLQTLRSVLRAVEEMGIGSDHLERRTRISNSQDVR